MTCFAAKTHLEHPRDGIDIMHHTCHGPFGLPQSLISAYTRKPVRLINDLHDPLALARELRLECVVR